MLKQKFAIFILLFNCSLFANVGNFELQAKRNIQSQLQQPTEIFFTNKKNIDDYYYSNNYKPFWIDENGIKKIGLSLIEKLKNDPVLKPQASKIFRLDEIKNISNALNKLDPNYISNLVKLDFILTESFDKYISYVTNGAIKWDAFEEKLAEIGKTKEIKASWDKYSLNENPKILIKKVIKENDLTNVLKNIDFNYPQVNELIAAIDELEQISANGGYTKVPEIKPLRMGDVSDVLPIFRKRLMESHDLVKQCEYNTDIQYLVKNNINTNTTYTPEEEANIEKLGKNCENVFDEDLKNAFISFQKKHGLNADGIAGLQTQRFMNIPASKKISIIRLNLERMRWLPRNLGEKYLLVNIPEYRLKLYENNDIKLNMAVVVGDTKFPTPIFSDKMSYVVLNPSWNIPDSIAKNEIIPKLLKDPKYLESKGIDIYAGWNGSAGEKIDSKEVMDNAILQNVDNLQYFRFSQTSSKENPLGKMKFMFPNKHSVYFHDTPAKSLFAQARRAFSHGCIRLSKPEELLSTIASEDKGIDINKAHEILANPNITEKTLGLEKKIPIHIVYLTSWVDENGVLQFREDIYNFDKIQKELLF